MTGLKKLLIVLQLIIVVPLNAQVLWSENFEAYNTGTFTTGQGGWNVITYGCDMQISTEPGKGKVLAWGWNQFPAPTGNTSSCSIKGLTSLWNNRTAGNNVLKLEFDFYSKDFTNAPGEVFQTGIGFDLSGVVFRCFIKANESYVDSSATYPMLYYKTAYNHTWIKVEVYMEYDAGTNTSYIYTYIPLLNYLGIRERTGFNIFNHNEFLISTLVQQPNKAFTGALMKYDNFKITAIPMRPSHVNTKNFLASKFNLFPNPATNVVNITNADNLYVESVTVYDVSGKEIKKQVFANESNIQLNVEDLASGAYMLHLQTNEGTAVKKIIKK